MLGIFEPSPSMTCSWVSLKGPDAKDFLHRITTVDVRGTGVGGGGTGCILTAQGRFRALFTLWNIGESEYAFELEDGPEGKWKREFLSAIDQYTFAEKLSLEDQSHELESRWLYFEKGRPIPAILEGLAAHQTTIFNDGIRACHHGDRDYAREWITVWGTKDSLNAWLTHEFSNAPKLALSEVEAWRIEALRPRVGAEISEAVMPVEVGIPDSVAKNKGCYPGQEVIEKIISLGSPPRRLAKIQGTGAPPRPGTKLFSQATPSTEVGEITSSTVRDAGFTALAIVRKIHARENLTVQVGSEPTSSSATIIEIAPYR